MAAPSFAGNGNGNEGTIKIGNWTLDHGNPPNSETGNEPHTQCEFDVEWYNFDAGSVSTVVFTAWAPTNQGSVSIAQGPSTLTLPAPADSPGADTDGQNEKIRYRLDYNGEYKQIPSTDKHGFKVKLVITTDQGGPNNNDTKSKVFWVEGCKTTIPAPAEQVPTAPTCDVAGSYSLPDDTSAVDWQISPEYDGPGTYAVKAVLKDKIKTIWSTGDTADKTWTVNVLDKTGNCPDTRTPVDIPAEQQPVAPTCDTNGSYTLPASDGPITWTISPDYHGPDTYTVTAALKDKTTHKWAGGGDADRTWTVKVLPKTGDCPDNRTPVDLPADQEPVGPTCWDDGSYSLPQSGNGVDWTINPEYDGVGNYVVTASLSDPTTTKWEDGTTADLTWPIEVKAATEDCPQKVTFCHATSAGKYETITTSINAFINAGHINGTGNHPAGGDIYPGFTYVDKHGVTQTVEPRGDQSLLAYKDCVKPIEATASATPTGPTCDLPGSVSWTGSNVTFNLAGNSLNGPADDVEVIATPVDGAVWSTGAANDDPRTIFDGDLAAATGYQSTDPQAPCYEEPESTKVWPTQPASVDPCGPGNVDWVWAKADFVSGGVNWDFSAVDNSWTATPVAGHVFDDGQPGPDAQLVKFTLPAEQNTAPCEEEPNRIPMPTPSVTDPCGVGNASWVLPGDGNGLAWTLSNGVLSVAITTPNTVFTTTGLSTHSFGVAPETNVADCPPPPPPAPLPVSESVDGCDLSEYDLEPGVWSRTGLQEYILSGGQYVLEPEADIAWNPWTGTAWTEEEFIANCVEVKPSPQVRTVTTERESCKLGGVETTTLYYEQDWVLEGTEWVLGPEVLVDTVVELEEYTEEQLEELCTDVAGEQEEETQTIKHELPDVEVKGEQEVAPAVPNAVDAGLGSTPNDPIGTGRDPLWLLAIGGGLGLIGTAGWRRRATANQ